jgi:hypothetical protein
MNDDDKKPEAESAPTAEPEKPADEIGGPAGPEPTRFGDWEKAGRCSDF